MITFLGDAVAISVVRTLYNKAVEVVETRTIHLAQLASLSRFEIINRLNGHCTYWQILSLVAPELSRDISLIPSIAKARAKMAGIMKKRVVNAEGPFFTISQF